MKKIVFVLFACLMCLSFATAETTPTVNIAAEAQGIPDTVVADIVSANPDGNTIFIEPTEYVEYSVDRTIK